LEKRYPGISRIKDEDAPEEPTVVAMDVADFDDAASIRLAIQALMEVVESPKNIEIATLKKGQPLLFLDKEEISKIVDSIEGEKKVGE